MKILGLILILAGILFLVYQGFNYDKTVQDAQIGTLRIQHQETDHVAIPPALGYGVIVLGVVLLVIPAGSRRG